MEIVYPGTFDPIHYGHINIIKRGSKLYNIVVGVGKHPEKECLFSFEERKYLVKESVKNIENIVVECFDGLLVDFMKKKNINVILRGLREVTDFENEYSMALANRDMSNVETIFLLTDKDYLFISSKLIKEIASLNGDVSKWVPPIINEYLIKKYKNK